MTTRRERPMETGDRAYRKVRARFRAQCEKVGQPCHLCGQRIDYTEDSRDPWELDHFYPRSVRPELALDPANFRPAHRSCNRSRGDAPVTPTLGVPSEDW